MVHLVSYFSTCVCVFAGLSVLSCGRSLHWQSSRTKVYPMSRFWSLSWTEDTWTDLRTVQRECEWTLTSLNSFKFCISVLFFSNVHQTLRRETVEMFLLSLQTWRCRRVTFLLPDLRQRVQAGKVGQTPPVKYLRPRSDPHSTQMTLNSSHIWCLTLYRPLLDRSGLQTGFWITAYQPKVYIMDDQRIVIFNLINPRVAVH